MKVSEYEEIQRLIGDAGNWLQLEGDRAYAVIGSTKVRLKLEDLEELQAGRTTPTIDRVNKLLDNRFRNLKGKIRASLEGAKKRGDSHIRLRRR